MANNDALNPDEGNPEDDLIATLSKLQKQISDSSAQLDEEISKSIETNSGTPEASVTQLTEERPADVPVKEFAEPHEVSDELPETPIEEATALKTAREIHLERAAEKERQLREARERQLQQDVEDTASFDGARESMELPVPEEAVSAEAFPDKVADEFLSEPSVEPLPLEASKEGFDWAAAAIEEPAEEVKPVLDVASLSPANQGFTLEEPPVESSTFNEMLPDATEAKLPEPESDGTVAIQRPHDYMTHSAAAAVADAEAKELEGTEEGTPRESVNRRRETGTLTKWLWMALLPLAILLLGMLLFGSLLKSWVLGPIPDQINKLEVRQAAAPAVDSKAASVSEELAALKEQVNAQKADLDRRLDLTRLGDDAIASGSRKAFDQLKAKVPDAPDSAPAAEVMRVNYFYESGDRLSAGYRIPVEGYASKKNDEDLTADELLLILANEENRWEDRARAAKLLGKSTSASVAAGIVKVLKTEPHLEVYKHLALSFEKITNYWASDIFDYKMLSSWWSTNEEKVKASLASSKKK